MTERRRRGGRRQLLDGLKVNETKPEVKRGRTTRHCVENSLRKSLSTYRKTDYVMMMMVMMVMMFVPAFFCITKSNRDRCSSCLDSKRVSPACSPCAHSHCLTTDFSFRGLQETIYRAGCNACQVFYDYFRAVTRRTGRTDQLIGRRGSAHDRGSLS